MKKSTPSSSVASQSAPEKGGPVRRFFTVTRNRFFTGMAVAIPLVATFWILNVGYTFIEGISNWFVQPILKEVIYSREEIATAKNVPVVAFVISVCLLLFLGFMATNVLGRKLIDWMDGLLLRIPVVSFVYAGIKQIIDSFRNFNRTENFKRVIYVEYPSPGCRLIGFVTGQFFDRDLEVPMTAVFIPTSPNPMTGFVIVVEDAKIQECSLTLEEASKIIFSAGLVSPATNPRQLENLEALQAWEEQGGKS